MPVSGGRIHAVVDSADFPLVAPYDWFIFRNTYAQTSGGILMHRLIAGARKGDGLRVDHRDGDGLNNTRQNLRIASQSQNRCNSRKRVAGESRYKGVSSTKSGKWRVYVGTRKNRKYLGLFTDELEAARAYDRKAVELFGEFACLNFPPPPQQTQKAA